MNKNRFSNYKYSLCKFFHNRGYNVNTKDKTIMVDVDSLTHKENQRLKQLQNWGFKVIDTTPKKYYSDESYEYQESFIDFTDEIIMMYSTNS